MSNSPTCYFPDGREAVGDTPCRSPSVGGGPSACCNEDHTCLDNKLCLETRSGDVEKIVRGSCTDRSWQSLGCPEYCADGNDNSVVDPSDSTSINLVDGGPLGMFCCGGFNSSTNTCMTSTNSSSSPFAVSAGEVIFNRTSGSTSPNNTNTATITITITTTAAPVTIRSTTTTTVTAKAKSTTTGKAPSTAIDKVTPAVSSLPSVPTRLPSPSTRKETAIAAGVSSTLGLGLFVALILLWKLKKQNLNLTEDVEMWRKHAKSMDEKVVKTGGGQQQPADELDDNSHLYTCSEVVQPRELDGAQIYEADNTIRRASDGE